MMETISTVIPPDVFSYVHACDGHIDGNLEASIDSDTSEAAPMQQFYADQGALAAIQANGAVYQAAEHSSEYQDPNAGGDYIPNPDAEVSTEAYAQNPANSGDAILPQEGVVQYTLDNRPYTWNASLQNYVYLDGVAPEYAESGYQAADQVQAEAVAVEDASQYVESPVVGESEATNAVDQEGYYAEDGNYYYYQTEAQVDPTQYAEQYSGEGGVYQEGCGEVTYEASEAVETQTLEAQVPEAVVETTPAEVICTPEERQRDLDVAFFGAEQAGRVAKRDAEARAKAMVSAQEQVHVQDYQAPAQVYADQSYQETPVAEQQAYGGDVAAYGYQEGTEGHAYDPAAYDPGTYVDEVPVDPAAAEGYAETYQIEGADAHGEQVLQAYEGDALQSYASEAPQGYEGGVVYESEVPAGYEGEAGEAYAGEVAQTLEYAAPQAYTEEAAQTYVEGATQDYGGEAPLEYAEGVSPEYANEVPQEYVGGDPQEYVGEVPQACVGEVPQEYVTDAPQEYLTEVQQEYATEAQQEYVPEIQQEYVPEVQQEHVGDVPQEVPQDYTGEATQEYSAEIPQAYAETADQAVYQEQVEGQYYAQGGLVENAVIYEGAEGYYDNDGNFISYAADATYVEQPEASADAGVAYDGTAIETPPAGETVQYYDSAEMTQEQVMYSQQEYIEDGQYYEQQEAVGAEVAVEEYYPEQGEVQQYSGQEVYSAAGSEVEGAYAAPTYEAGQGFVAEDGTAVPATIEYQTEAVLQSGGEPYAQSDQGYLSEPANESAECPIEAAAGDQPVATYAETGELVQQNTEEYSAPEGQSVEGTAQYYEDTTQYAEDTTQYADGTAQYADGTAQYADGTAQYANGSAQYAEVYAPEDAQAYDQQYVSENTPEQQQAYIEEYAAHSSEPYSAEATEQCPQEYVDQGAYAEQATEDYQQQQSAEYVEQYPQVNGEQAQVDGESYIQQNGELPEEVRTEPVGDQKSNASKNIVRGKPFTREMDSTEKFKSFQIEYERTPAFDAFGHCLKFLGVRRGFVCSIRADGVVCVQLKGAQLDEWQDTEFEYDASKPAAKVEVGHMYIIEHSFDGNKYMERCRVKDVNNDTAFIQLIDTGCERTIPTNLLYDIVNLDEVQRLPPQVVEIFVTGLTYQGYSKEDLEQLELEWNPYEEVYIIPVDAPKGELIRTIVSRKTGETLGIRAAPRNARKTP